MSMTDPVADLFIRLLNAGRRAHPTVGIPASKLKANILSVLQTEGFIQGFEKTTTNGHPSLTVTLRYHPGREKKPLLEGIKRVSKPGHRIYVGKAEIPRVIGGLGVAIISTSKGVVTDSEARKNGMGGEVLCYVW